MTSNIYPNDCYAVELPPCPPLALVVPVLLVALGVLAAPLQLLRLGGQPAFGGLALPLLAGQLVPRQAHLVRQPLPRPLLGHLVGILRDYDLLRSIYRVVT